MPNNLRTLLLDFLLAATLFLPGFVIGWGAYPSILYSTVFVLIIIVYLLIIKNIPKFLAVILSIPIIALQLANISSYVQFDIPFEYGALQILLNSDWADIKEFIPLMGPVLPVAAMALLIFYGFCLWKLISSPIKFVGWRQRLSGVVLLAMMIPILDYFHKSRLDVYSYIHVYRLAFKYSAWQKEIELISKKRKASFLSKPASLSLEQQQKLDDIVIVIIGESMRRRNLSLYGYDRKTTPNLDRRKNQLIVFSKAISPANSSVISLIHMFTPLVVGEKRNLLDVPSLVGDVRLAGFDTTWISNTNLLGRHSSSNTIMAHDANSIMVTRPEGRNEKFYLTDLAILPLVDKFIANNNGKKKFLFLATRGSHAIYRKRVPEQFRKFRPIIEGDAAYSPSLRDKIVNSYDNSILTTDWFIEQLIQRLEATARPATLIYFSDHGQRLYEDGRTIVHGFKTPRKIEVNVPFFIWQSRDRNCKTNKLQKIKNRPVNLQSFYEITRYVTCIANDLPSQLFTPQVLAVDTVFNYNELKEQ